MIEKKNYPISVLEDISDILKYFYSIEYKYLDILEMRFNEAHLVEIKSKNNSGYRFILSTPSQATDKKTWFQINKFPRNISTNEEHRFTIQVENVVGQFNAWLSTLERYESISLSKEDLFSKEEEKQFYDEFEITSEEGDIRPLTVENQFKVYELLEELQLKLENKIESNPEVKEIIDDAEKLKYEIQDLPQKVLAKRIAKIKVKIKKIGIKLFKDVVDVAYKEAIKFALRGGVDGINHMIQ
ncbi:MAG: hypothetical protein QM737_18845 [Ferruginibacter sp.]